MAKAKDLYIAKSMKELNEKCRFDFDKDKSIKANLTMVNKLYQAADTAFSSKDEERAYVLYMRYVDAMMNIRKTKDYKSQVDYYNTLFVVSKLTTAMDNAEKLSHTLKMRYSKLENASGNNSSEKKIKEADLKADLKSKSKEMSNSNNSSEYSFPTTSINVQELQHLLYKSKHKVLLMDIRSLQDYQESHFIHSLCINVPNNVITPGCVPSKIEKGILLDDTNLWNSRDTVDLVVLIDWHSKEKRLSDKSDPLRSLKDSIFKWDMQKQLIREPVILEGGYTEWLENFPQFTSNPHVNPPSNKPKTSNVNSLLDFNYADLKKNFASLEEETSAANQKDKVLSNGFSIGSDVNKEASIVEQKSPKMNKSSSIQNPLAGYESLNSNVASMYPKINESVPVSNKQTNASDLPSESVSANKKIPSIDRSTKPKIPSASERLPSISSTIPESTTNSDQSLSSQLPDKNSTSDIAVAVNRSNKPIPPANTDNISISKPEDLNKRQSLISKKTEIDVLQEDIAKMQKDKVEREKRVMEMEEQKRLQLLSLQERMKRENEELKERELKAKEDLAATMRQVKPSSQTSSKRNSVDVDSKCVSSTPEVKKTVDTTESKRNSVPASTITDFKAEKTKFQDGAKSSSEIVANNLSNISSNSHVDASATLQPETATSPINLPSKVKATSQLVNNKNISTNTSGYSSPVHSDAKESVSSTSVSVHNISDTSSNSKSKSSSGTVSSAVYHTPKDQSDHQSVGLKRSFSSPNIAKMVQQEGGSTTSVKPTIPVRPSVPQPNRNLKPLLQDEPDPVLSSLGRSLRGVYGGQGFAMCGLRNLGNSCYMNSVLQCMFSTTHLADYILSYAYRQDINRKNAMGYGGKVAESFAVLLRAIWTGQFRYLIPSDMKEIAGNINDNFSGYSQEDSHEFLLFLLDGLHEDMNRIATYKYESEPDNNNLTDSEAADMAWTYHKKRNQSIIVELFTGQYKATLVCSACGKTSKKFEAFRFLTLSLPSHSSSLDDLIKDFSKQEKLTGDDRWKCPKCKVPREAFRTIQIWKLPPILIIHLKRFVYSGRWRDKIHSNVSFPLSNMDVSKYACGPHKRAKYDLYAASHHHGAGLDSGHYTASCRSVVDNRWYRYDDTEVNVSSPPQDSSAFILFYSSLPRKVPAHVMR